MSLSTSVPSSTGVVAFFPESDMAARAAVQKMMTKVEPPQVVPSYLKLKHCHSGDRNAHPARHWAEKSKNITYKPS